MEVQKDEAVIKTEQVREEKIEELRKAEVSEQLQKKREESLNENPEDVKVDAADKKEDNNQDNKEEEQQEDEEKTGISFEQITGELRTLFDEFADDFDKIVEACNNNRFVEKCKFEVEFQNELKSAAEAKNLQEYFKLILQKANPVMTQMFAEISKNGAEVEMPKTVEEFNQIAWEDLQKPIDNEGEEYDEEEEEEGEEEEEEEEGNEKEEKEEKTQTEQKEEEEVAKTTETQEGNQTTEVAQEAAKPEANGEKMNEEVQPQTEVAAQ